MKSMTGFGRASFSSRDLELEVSVRAVNGRFLEPRLHLPREYFSFEAEIKKQVSKVMSRGSVDVYVNRNVRPEARSAEVVGRPDLAQSYVKAFRSLAKAAKIDFTFSLDALVRVPELVSVREETGLVKGEEKHALKVISEAITACQTEREREGKSLATELESLLTAMDKQVVVMEGLRSAANAELETRYRDRIQRLGVDGQVEPQRLAQEIVFQLEKAEISEELTRLKEHLRAYKALLKQTASQGKKMDFYAQELLREVNTIGSKSQVAGLTAAVVEAKTIVEKIREQVQNIE